VTIGQGVGQRAELVAEEQPRLSVAATGQENVFVRRFIAAMPGVTQAGDASSADVVIAVGADLPAGVPGIAFQPPTPPAGWGYAGDAVGPLALADAGVLADAELLRDVSLDRVAVRRVRPLTPADSAAGQRLVVVPGVTLILASESRRRLTIAFDPSAANTDWGLDESFPILLANALSWLSPKAPGVSWHLSDDTAGAIGLQSADAPEPDLAAVPLPEPMLTARPMEFWPYLVILAGLLWLAGWRPQMSRLPI